MFSLLLLSLVAVDPAASVAAQQDPPVRISLNNDSRFEPGDRAKVKVRVEDDGFLIVLQADTEGRVRMLFPLDPDDDNYVRGNRSYEIRGRGDREPFTVDGAAGEGAIYAAVSRDPFRFDQFVLNNHWDYQKLSEQRLPEQPEPELTQLVASMAVGRFEYDYTTYDVYEYGDVAYSSGYPQTVIHTTSYVDPFCSSGYYFRYDCDPYYYRPRYSVNLVFGRPYYDRYYSPYYYGYYDSYYYNRPYYGRPTYGYPSYPYASTPYRPRYVTPSEFKQENRLWDGQNYRDRSAEGATNIRAVNTVYGEPPVRRATGDAGRSPVTAAPPSTSVQETPSRRRTSASPAAARPASDARSTAEPRQAPPERQAAPARRARTDDRSSSQVRPDVRTERRAAPTRSEAARSEEPRLQRRAPRPSVERAPAPASRAAPPPRNEPSRSAPPPSSGGGRRRTAN